MSDLNIVEIDNDDIQIIIDGAVVSWSEIYGDPTKCASLMKLLEQLLKKKVDSNDPIEPATKCKITYDEKGLVALGEDLTIEDLPPLHLENIIDVIATAEEVNILSGIEVTTEELNKLKGLIATSTELNILSGVKVTTEELNRLKGLLVSAVTLNLLDGIRSNVQEQIDSKQNNLGFTAENIANKTDNYEVSDSNLYPSTLALKNGLDTKQDKLTAEQLNNLNKGATTDDISMLQQNKVDSNAPIMPATKCKITYDEKGLVTLGEDLEDTDIPTIPFAKLNDVNVTNVEINRLKGLTVEAPELNQLEGVSDNVQNQINNINGMIPKEANEENKLADKTYVVNWVDDHAGYFVSKDAKNTPFSSYAELLSTIHFYNNGRPKRISDNDFTVVTCDETRNNAVIMYAWIKDEIYNEGHWKYQYKVSNYYDELSFNWGTITGNINDQTDLVNALNKKQNTLVNQQNIKSIDGNSLLGEGNITIDKYTKSEADSKFLTEHQDISHLATKTELSEAKNELNTRIDNIRIPTDVSAFNNDVGYLTEHQDISHLATKTELENVNTALTERIDGIVIPTNISAFNNDVGYLTEHQDISDLATKDELATKADKTALSAYATTEAMNAKLSAYATTEAMNAELATKADTSALATKADKTALSAYATTSAMNSALEAKADKTALSEYATTEAMNTKLATKADTSALSAYATTSAMNSALATKADKTALDAKADKTALNNVNTTLTERIDGIVIPTNISAFTNDVGYLTEHQDISGLATKEELSTSISGLGENIVLSGTYTDGSTFNITIKGVINA